MDEESVGKFDVRIKLKLIRSLLPFYRKHLKPSKIVPHMGMLLGGTGSEERRKILDLEKAGKRMEAVDVLMEFVLAKKEDGFNLFKHAMREACQKWDTTDIPLELESDASGKNNNEEANKYFAIIVGLFEGQIIKLLTEGELRQILYGLKSSVVDDEDMEEIEATLRSGERHFAAVQMFTLISIYQDWPQKFLRELEKVKPVLLHKMGPLVIDNKEAADDASGATSSEKERLYCDEQTVPKEYFSRQQDAIYVKQTKEPEYGRQRGSGATAFRLGDDDDDATSDVDSDGTDFSDEEKYRHEATEKDKKPEKPKQYDESIVRPPREHHKPLELKLRNYQLELAAHALTGRNVIICAPTGSGKTRVALHIVQQHLQNRTDHNKKVVFLARTGPLVAQQCKTFKKYLPHYPSVLVTGESEHSQNLHGLMPEYDILVLTPKILENHLTPDKIPSLDAFSLIIFDECHHTRKGEPYNSVMKNYLKSKQKEKKCLPQIVGLTASIGVEKATTIEKAKESILGIMANLDVLKIATVKEHVQELKDTVPRPEELLVELTPREQDDVSSKIFNIMAKLEEELARSKSKINDRDTEEVCKILAKPPGDRREQKYGQWAVILRNQARLLKIPSNPSSHQEAEKIEKRRTFSHEIQILADSLIAYNEALDVHDLSRPQDVLEYLRQKFLFQRTYRPPEVDVTTLEERVFGYFKDLEKMLDGFNSPNPNLDTLALTILQHLANKEGEDSHIIIFVRTRATCLALCNWLNSDDVDVTLQMLNAQPFTGSGAHQDQGGMTQNMQESVIEKFRTGQVKLIVSTSVGEEGIDIPECNLTIKYNHVGNEVTTVQTRGRSRKHGGVSFLLAMPRIIQQERVNRQRERYMIQAIEQISHMSERDTDRQVKEIQRKNFEAEEINEVVKKVKKLPRKKGTFTLACCQCYKVRVDGSKIRKIQDAHRVIVGHSIDDKVTMHAGSSTRCFDEMEFRGSVICRCKNRLGQLLFYKGVKFTTLGIRYWVVLDAQENPSTYKKWKDLPFDVEELTAADIREHLGISGDDSDEDEGAVGGLSD